MALAAGDVLVLPAGTGRGLIEADPGFEVVGAHPPGQEWDLCCEAPDAAALGHIRAAALPAERPRRGRRWSSAPALGNARWGLGPGATPLPSGPVGSLQMAEGVTLARHGGLATAGP